MNKESQRLDLGNYIAGRGIDDGFF